jgi:hypothetical protein
MSVETCKFLYYVCVSLLAYGVLHEIKRDLKDKIKMLEKPSLKCQGSDIILD